METKHETGYGKAVVEFSTELFLELFTQGYETRGYRVIEQGIPPDAKLLGVHIDHFASPACIQFVIESPSLPYVKPGNLLPRLNPTLQTLDAHEVTP